MHYRNHQIEKEIKPSPPRHTPSNRGREGGRVVTVGGFAEIHTKSSGRNLWYFINTIFNKEAHLIYNTSRISFFHSRDDLHRCPNQQKNQLFLGLLNLIAFDLTSSYHLTSAIRHVSHPILKLLSKGKTEELEKPAVMICKISKCTSKLEQRCLIVIGIISLPHIAFHIL